MILDDIITAVNASLKAMSCFQTAKMCGLAETVTVGDRTNPVWNQNGNGMPIVPDANSGIQVYFRLVNESAEEQDSPFGQFGFDVEKTVGLYVIGAAHHFFKSCGMKTQEAVTSLVMNSLPVNDIASADASGIHIDRASVIGTKSDILSQEFPGWDYSNHVLDIIAVGVELRITGTACKSIC